MAMTLPFSWPSATVRDALRDYCHDHFELELEQFDAEFLLISLAKN